MKRHTVIMALIMRSIQTLRLTPNELLREALERRSDSEVMTGVLAMIDGAVDGDTWGEDMMPTGRLPR